LVCQLKIGDAKQLTYFYRRKKMYAYMTSEITKIQEAVSFLQQQYSTAPQVGIVLGSGLGEFTKEITIEKEIPYNEIPHFPVVTVKGHSGKLIFGTINNRPIVAMSGRFHYYEGYTPQQVIFPIRVMKLLGIQALLLSNAAGGVGDGFKVGDLMVITDHISFSIVNPLLGTNIEELGARFPDMTEPYSKKYIGYAKEIAAKAGITLQQGVYYGVTGPTFETKAEYKMIHTLGAHAVGMSTVQEVIAACHMLLPVFAMSVITDLGIREEDNVITHEEVLQAAKEAEPKFSHIFKEMVGLV
jgi:purine-nucleoside phosphorylase